MTRAGAKLAIVVILGAVLAAILLFATRSTDPPGTVTLNWKESVALSSGASIEIARFVSFTWNQPLADPRSADVIRDAWLESTADPPAFPRWQAPMVPMVIDRDPVDGAWIIVASIENCDFWDRNGQPWPPYWAFRVESEKWMRIPVPEAFWGRAANVLVRYDKDDDDRSLRSVVSIRKSYQPPLSKYDTLAVVDANAVKACSPGDMTGLGSGELDLLQFWR